MQDAEFVLEILIDKQRKLELCVNSIVVLPGFWKKATKNENFKVLYL